MADINRFDRTRLLAFAAMLPDHLFLTMRLATGRLVLIGVSVSGASSARIEPKPLQCDASSWRG